MFELIKKLLFGEKMMGHKKENPLETKIKESQINIEEIAKTITFKEFEEKYGIKRYSGISCSSYYKQEDPKRIERIQKLAYEILFS